MDEWREVRSLFERCLGLDSASRAKLLSGASTAVRTEVEDLLLSHEEGEGLFREGDGGRRLGELAELRPKVGERVGEFVLVEELGQGGTGSVYRAEQSRPRRSVAIKVLSTAFFGPRNQQRFQLEIELLASLRHEGIAQVFSAGFTDLRTGLGEVRVPYYVREFVEDSRTLDRWRAEENRSERDVLRVVLDVARAMQHAHERGVVHLDLKPQNVLIDNSGRVKIIDFGSGRQLSASDSQSNRSTLLAGTPAYMAPEQFGAHIGAADTRIDVYAMGVIAFELLTGVPAFDDNGASARAVELGARSAPRPGLEDHIPGVSRELSAIVATAVHQDPARRYGGAGALVRELECYLDRRAVEAYGGGILYQVRVWARRNRIASLVVASLVGSVLVLGVAVQAKTARALLAERTLLEKSLEETDATVRAIDLAIHAIARLPNAMTYSLHEPNEQRLYWLRLAVENLQLIEDAVPIGRETALALARAYATVARVKSQLEGLVDTTKVVTDAIDRAAEYVDMYAEREPRGDAGGLLDTIEFEIGLDYSGLLSSFLGMTILRAVVQEAPDVKEDHRAGVNLKYLLMQGDRRIRLGDVAGGLALYREELERQRKSMVIIGDDLAYPAALLALRRRVAAIESFQGRGRAARPLLREVGDLFARMPESLHVPGVEYEAAMAQLMLGSSLSQDGEWIEGEALINGAKAKLEQLGATGDAAAQTTALVRLRVAQFLLDRGRADRGAADAEGVLREAIAIASGLRWRSASGLVGDLSLVRLMLDKESQRIVVQAEEVLRG
jgi:predicted Ser/Thr protein kinase